MLICINVIVSLINLGAIEPVLTKHLIGYGVPEILCGIFFVIPTFSYVLGVVLLNILP